MDQLRQPDYPPAPAQTALTLGRGDCPIQRVSLQSGVATDAVDHAMP
jgi:hypothetical protein